MRYVQKLFLIFWKHLNLNGRGCWNEMSILEARKIIAHRAFASPYSTHTLPVVGIMALAMGTSCMMVQWSFEKGLALLFW